MLAPELRDGCGLVLFGNEQLISDGLADMPPHKGTIEIVHCPEVISMADKPIKRLRPSQTRVS